MFFTIRFFKYGDDAWDSKDVKECSLYDAFVRARKGTTGSEYTVAEIYDTHGQFITYFENGELKHGDD